MAGPLLEADLERVVIGTCGKQSQTAERAVKLWVRAQKIDEWNLVIIVNGFRLVEDVAGIINIEQGLKWIIHQTIQDGGGRVAIRAAGHYGHSCVGVGNDLIANRRRQEVAIGGSRIRAERKMCAAAGGVIHADSYSPGEEVLHAKIPLIDFRIAR